jgi:hypothetical protein
MGHQNTVKPKDQESVTKGSVRLWATEHKVILAAAIIGAVGAIVAAIITAAPDFIGPVAEKEFDDDYVVNYSFYNVLLDGFSPVPDEEVDGHEKSVVTVERIDSINKNTDSKEDYMLPFYTTGKRIELNVLKSSVKVVFHEVKNLDEKYKHSYELRLAIGSTPPGHNEVIQSRFKFVNGFRDGNEEWWTASIKYPTKAVGVHIQCPEYKLCKSVRVFRRKGISEKKEILDNPAFLSEDGLHILWMGNTEKPDTRIVFQWEWCKLKRW